MPCGTDLEMLFASIDAQLHEGGPMTSTLSTSATIRRLLMAATAIALGALVLAAWSLAAAPAHAGGDEETPAPTSVSAGIPAKYYGTWSPFDVVIAYINEVACADAKADGEGKWTMEISADAPCEPKTGDKVTFTRNGKLVAAAEIWASGDVPDNIELGINDDLAPEELESAVCGVSGAVPGKGTVLNEGVTLLVTTGSCTAPQLIEDVLKGACSIASLWVTVAGQWVGFTAGAPAFVNEGFPAFQKSAPFLVICRS